jgi:hypothetical protein
MSHEIPWIAGREPEAGSWKLEAGSWKLEAGSWIEP